MRCWHHKSNESIYTCFNNLGQCPCLSAERCKAELVGYKQSTGESWYSSKIIIIIIFLYIRFIIIIIFENDKIRVTLYKNAAEIGAPYTKRKQRKCIVVI